MSDRRAAAPKRRPAAGAKAAAARKTPSRAASAAAAPGPKTDAPPLRCAVIGAGRMGRLHAMKFAADAQWSLVAVVDSERESAQRVASEFGTEALTDYRELAGRIDAAAIAVPTALHHAVARDLLEAGVHLLIEKPITVTVAEADELIELARRKRLTLQVGHIERFNAALLALDLKRGAPRFVEAVRIAPFTTRGADVSVVLDLMIHDIDLILDLVDAEVERVDAVGTPVFTSDVDIANARLVFANGCVANVTASRVSQKVERKLRLFLADAYVSIDLANRAVQKVLIGERGAGGLPQVHSETLNFAAGDALAAEIRHFGDCIRSGTEPLASGVAARRALALAAQIGQLLNTGIGNAHTHD
jgi:predicted dehydrogenase